MTQWMRIFGALAALVVPFGVLYWFTSYERAGSIMMGFFVLALVFLGVCLLVQGRGAPPLPEDDPQGEPGADDEDLGYFPSRSIWPFVIGVGAMMVAYGLVFSAWLAVPGMALLATAAIGYAAEAQRAD